MKIRSKASATRIIKRLFSNTNEDAITLEEAFRAWGRHNPENIEIHKSWLSNVMHHLKYHNLIVPSYTFGDGPRKLTKIRLTLEGKRALGRIQNYTDNNASDEELKEIKPTPSIFSSISISDVMKIVAKLRTDNPEYDITFDVKLKSNQG